MPTILAVLEPKFALGTTLPERRGFRCGFWYRFGALTHNVASLPRINVAWLDSTPP